MGPFIAAGALATTLGGAAIGAGVGAIAGALIGMGIPEEEARYYEEEVRGGRTLVAVRADGRLDEADGILHDHGAYDVQHRDRAAVGAGTPGGALGRWEDEAPRYRSRWQERYGTTGGRWEDYEPAYRYGYELRSRPEYRGRGWDEVEPDLRRDWERRYPNTPWDRTREAVRETWEEATT